MASNRDDKKKHVKNKTTIWADAVTAIFDSMFDALVSTLHDLSFTMFFFKRSDFYTPFNRLIPTLNGNFIEFYLDIFRKVPSN